MPSPNHSIGFFDTIAPYSRPGSDKSLAFVAWKIKTPENIGSIMRCAGNIGCQTIFVVENDSKPHSEIKIKRVSRSSAKFVEVIFVNEHELWQQLDPSLVPVAIETSPESVNVFTHQLPDKVALFLGNEKDGLPANIIERCQLSVHIPMTGPIKSMNVSQAATVVAFEWLRQMMFQK
jgi:tRNA G18 (ribose-2'-O)-methylase SpoU